MDYHKKYLKYRNKYLELKNNTKNQTGGDSSLNSSVPLAPGNIASYSRPLFNIGERVENTINYNSGIVKNIRQIEKSVYTPGVYENYYEIKYDNGNIETVSETVLIRSNNYASPSIFNPSGSIIKSKKYKQIPQSSIYDPYNQSNSLLYKPTIHYDDKPRRKSSRKSTKSNKSSKKSSQKSRKSSKSSKSRK